MDGASVAGTRERILRAAEELFGDRGYAGTRLHEIARRVGVQKASLFHHFASKEELYRAVLDEGYGQTERTIRGALESPAPPIDRIRALTEAYVDIVSAHPARTKIFLRQSLGDAPPGPRTEQTQHLIRLVVDFICECQKAKSLAATDAHALVLGVIGMVAFFFTSAPVVAPNAFGDPWKNASVIERVKRHVVNMVEGVLSNAKAHRVAASARAAV